MTDNTDEIPTYPPVLPRSDIPTHKELATWLAEGKGELLDLNNFNTVLHSHDYSLEKENECLQPLDVCYYRVRAKDDTAWYKPSIKAMGIQRWDMAKFAAYMLSKYDGHVRLSIGVLAPDLYFGNLRIANFAMAVTEIGGSPGELIEVSTVPWENLTDQDVVRLEKDIQRIIDSEGGIGHETANN